MRQVGLGVGWGKGGEPRLFAILIAISVIGGVVYFNWPEPEDKFWTGPEIKLDYICPNNLLTRVGREGDGGKWMCGLESFGRRSMNAGFNTNCVVYSFGVKDDSSFEAAVLASTTCSLYGYDPSVDEIGTPLKMSNPRVNFQKMGLAGAGRVTTQQ